MSEHWEPVIPYVYRRGALIQRDSGDCGRWVNFDPSVDWVCEYCSKYYKQKYEVTQDGITWYDSGLRRRGAIYDTESDDCCIYRWYQIPITDDYICDDCDPQPTGYKWVAYYFNDRKKSAECDSSSVLIGGEINYTSSSAFDGPLRIEIGSCVTRINQYTFFRFSNLKRVAISDSITSIGDMAFNGCSGLFNITINATTPPTLGNEVFDGTNQCPIYVPSGSVNAYKNAWPQYANRIQAKQQIIYTASSKLNINLTNFTPAATAETYDESTGVGTIEFFGTVTHIGTAFVNEPDLISVIIPNSVVDITGQPFRLSGIGSITINATTPPTIGSQTLDYTNNCPIHVPSGSVNAYKTATNWTRYASRIMPIQ